MINYFRKIRKKLADDNRPLKYARYAIGEIVLVVIGILIALQINTLNEEFKEKKALVSDLKNAQRYIQGEIEREETERQKLISWNDTIQHSLRIIEELDAPSPVEKNYLKRARVHLLKVGLRTGEINTLQKLSASISKSTNESRHELVKALSQLMNEIQKGDYLENSFYEELLAMDRSLDRTIWRANSKGESIYNFELMKTDYDLQHLFIKSVNFKKILIRFCTRIIELYGVVDIQIEKLLNKLE